MKIVLVALMSLVLSSVAFAIAPAGTPIQVKMLDTTISTSTYKVLITSTARAIKNIVASNSGTAPLKVGMALPSATANTEVGQLIIPATPNSSLAQLYPISIPANVRLSVIALGAGVSSSTGELDLSVLY